MRCGRRVHRALAAIVDGGVRDTLPRQFHARCDDGRWSYGTKTFDSLLLLILIPFVSAFNVRRALPPPPLPLHPAAHSLRQNEPDALGMLCFAATRLQRCVPGHPRHARQYRKLFNVFARRQRRSGHYGMDCAATLAHWRHCYQWNECTWYSAICCCGAALSASCWHVDRLGVTVRQVRNACNHRRPCLFCPHVCAQYLASCLFLRAASDSTTSLDGSTRPRQMLQMLCRFCPWRWLRPCCMRRLFNCAVAETS